MSPEELDGAAAGLPEHQVAANQGKLLHLIARVQGARSVLEIGTLGGYSTIWLARALPGGGRLVTLEADERCAEVARANVARAGLGDVVELRPGSVIVGDNVVRDGAVTDPDPDSDDPRVQGIRRFTELIAEEPRLTATTVQTVGSKGYDGFTLALVTG
ncbi:O-methyltransferase [Streptomyces sp. NPDC051913]|uniref:O-methyltransferase n=1 Tax=Streptomyces sp. NPDC051913 TaxID=3365676 RepID=UPI0037D96DA5